MNPLQRLIVGVGALVLFVVCVSFLPVPVEAGPHHYVAPQAVAPLVAAPVVAPQVYYSAPQALVLPQIVMPYQPQAQPVVAPQPVVVAPYVAPQALVLPQKAMPVKAPRPQPVRDFFRGGREELQQQKAIRQALSAMGC